MHVEIPHRVSCRGQADGNVKADNLGLEVISPDGKRRVVRSSALTGGAPQPFANEPSGLAGENGNERGTRMHHKFVVIDFNTPDARVYFGSYNFSEPADLENGENLVFIKDRTIATSYMIEALRLYDHYRFPMATSSCPSSMSNVGNIMHRVYDFASGSADNRNVRSITNCPDTTRGQVFAYDPLNRIQSAMEGTIWGQLFGHMSGSQYVSGYDAWGNLKEITATVGSATTRSQTLTPANN